MRLVRLRLEDDRDGPIEGGREVRCTCDEGIELVMYNDKRLMKKRRGRRRKRARAGKYGSSRI